MCIWSRRGRRIDGPVLAYKVFRRRKSHLWELERLESPAQGTPWPRRRLTAHLVPQPERATPGYPVGVNDSAGIYAFQTRKGAEEYVGFGSFNKVKRVRLTGAIIFHEGEPYSMDGAYAGYRAEKAQILRWWQRS